MVKQIKLTQGRIALVDDADYARVNRYKWQVLPGGRTFYAMRKTKLFRKTIYLHQEIMQPPAGIYIDHIDGNGLDCRRANMRLATNTENQHNARKRVDNTSGYKGVSWRNDKRKWRAQIRVNGKQIHLGYFVTVEAAARAYDKAVKEYHGEFARTNF